MNSWHSPRAPAPYYNTQAFNHLCQYAGYHTDNDAKKQDRFRWGLNTKLKECLNLVKANTFSELVNMALT
jgi:hypothetical protein